MNLHHISEYNVPPFIFIGCVKCCFLGLYLIFSSKHGNESYLTPDTHSYAFIKKNIKTRGDSSTVYVK